MEKTCCSLTVNYVAFPVFDPNANVKKKTNQKQKQKKTPQNQGPITTKAPKE